MKMVFEGLVSVFSSIGETLIFLFTFPILIGLTILYFLSLAYFVKILYIISVKIKENNFLTKFYKIIFKAEY